MEPLIEILGVYRPEIPKAVYHEQWQVTASDELTDAHLKDLVLIEAQVEGADDKFSLADMGQNVVLEGFPEHFQCAYDEALLSADGNSVIKRDINCVKGTGPLRFAFYLHFYDLSRPLQWSYGEIECPPVEPVPERLKKLVPYNACT
jgi:hypothetical protein